MQKYCSHVHASHFLCESINPTVFFIYSIQETLEEELESFEDSAVTEPSFVDMNIMCDENTRGPFFKVTALSFVLMSHH